MNHFIKLLFVALVVSSCGSNVEFKDTEELIHLSDFQTKNKSDYRCVGSYKINDKPIASIFDINSHFDMLIVNLGKKSTEFNIITKPESQAKIYGTYAGLAGNFYSLDYHFDLQSLKDISNIEFYSDGEILRLKSNDSVNEYYTKFNTSSLKFNDVLGLHLESGTQDGNNNKLAADIMIYQSNKELYLFIMTALDKNRQIEQGAISNYLFNNK